VHINWKDAIVGAAETDTVFLNRFASPGLRALRTERTTRLEREDKVGMDQFAGTQQVYFGGDLEAGIALTGQVAGRITEVLPVQEILWGTVREFRERVEQLNRLR
jgi:enoyl-[acyl-carrier protein] reductase II